MSGAAVDEANLGDDGEAAGLLAQGIGGLGTPSEPGTPEGMRLNPLLMSADPWDWKTDAPEFVPVGQPFQSGPGSPAAAPSSASPGGVQMRPMGPCDCAGATIGPSIWAMVAPGPWGAVAVPMGAAAGSTGGTEEEMQQLRALYEWQVQRQDEELAVLQKRMSDMERKRAEIKERWEREREALVSEIIRYRSLLEQCDIPLDEVCDPVAAAALLSSAGAGGRSWSSSCSGGLASMEPGTGAAPYGVPYGSHYMGVPAGLAEGAPAQACAPVPHPGCSWAHNPLQVAPTAALQDGSLDAKMRRLNGLLLDRTGGDRQADTPLQPGAPPQPGAPLQPGASLQPGAVDREAATASAELSKNKADDMPFGASSIASTLQAMFPHATVRTQAPDLDAHSEARPGGVDMPSAAASTAPLAAAASGAPRGASVAAAHTAPSPVEETAGGASTGELGKDASADRDNPQVSAAASEDRRVGALADDEVNRLAEDLEEATRSLIDERALKALQRLPVTAAREVLVKVNDLVKSQGGKCRNLSSIMQSTIRKLERRQSGRDAADGDGEGAATVADGAGFSEASGSAQPSRRRRTHGAEEADAFGSEDGSASAEEGSASRARRRFRRGDSANAETIDDLHEEGGGGARSSQDSSSDYWTAGRIEKMAHKRFSLKHLGDRWELKMLMGSMDPPLSESGMELYCQWLRAKLADFKEEHGALALRRCCGEVDFSNNKLSNQAIWVLLETLAQYEVQATILKFYKNRISQGGVLAICEFVRSNKRAGAIREMHLSHNEIDDEAVGELLRTLNDQKSRYPPRRAGEASEASASRVPVWMRLNHNRVRDPAALLKSLQAEGISSCLARSTHGCGPTRCTRPDCPLVHLYLFNEQSASRGGGSPAKEWQPVDSAAECPPPRRRGGRRGRERHGEEA